MKYAKVKYKGATDKIGRFNTVETGDTLTLTETEYDCVREDERYEFIDWQKEELKPSVAPSPAGQYGGHTEQSPTVEAPLRSVSLSEEDVEADTEEADEEDVEDYNDLTVKELKAEIAARNELLEEEDQISDDGKKADLVAALEANDDEEGD